MNWNDIIMKKRNISRWILFILCLVMPVFSVKAEALRGTPKKEALLEMVWDCLEESNFSCVRTNLAAIRKAELSERETEAQKDFGSESEATTEVLQESKQEDTSDIKVKDFTATQYIFVGDSRTVGMQQSVGDAGCIWIGQVSAGLSWFQDSAVAEVDAAVTQGSVIIINMGVNDLGNVWGYIDLLKAKIPQWMEKGAEVYYMSVNPVENHPYISNEDIANFNNILYNNLPSEAGWIETDSYLLESGYSTQDGVHFDAATYQKIFNYTMEVLSGFGRQ